MMIWGGGGCMCGRDGEGRRGERGGIITDAETEEEEEGDGVGAQAPVQVALLGLLLGSVVHWDG